jgi:8-oxo-dGTP pyrophosphatase MutT (NUDIX family)
LAVDDRDALTSVVSAIKPLDELEAEHQTAVVQWIASGADLYRVAKPATPPQHLVSYVVLVDVDAYAILLVDHRNARLWLPTGGHVEPGEDPAATAHRELREELGIEGHLLDGLSSNPLFVTQTTTVGGDAGHVDVSLWYPIAGSLGVKLAPDAGEFENTRWWSFDEIASAPAHTLDPHLPRFVTKLRREIS